MKRNKIIIIRSLETLFIILNAVAFKGLSVGSSVVYKFTFNFALISIDPYASEVIIDTAVIGYLLSLVATLFMYKNHKTYLYKVSLILSTLGIVTFILETIRFFSMHHFQVVIQAGVILIIIDWYVLLRKEEKASEVRGAIRDVFK